MPLYPEMPEIIDLEGEACSIKKARVARPSPAALFVEDEPSRTGTGLPVRALGRKSAALSGMRGMWVVNPTPCVGIDSLPNRRAKHAGYSYPTDTRTRCHELAIARNRGAGSSGRSAVKPVKRARPAPGARAAA